MKYKNIILIYIFGLSRLLGSSEIHGINGMDLDLFSVLPFVGILLSISIIPLLAPQFWHHHYGKIALFWALLFIIPFSSVFGIELTIYEFLHVMLLEYIPFIVLLLSLYTVGGGICIKRNLVGTPKFNVALLLLGTSLSSWMGTTGSAMLLIRPLIRANKWRKYLL